MPHGCFLESAVAGPNNSRVRTTYHIPRCAVTVVTVVTRRCKDPSSPGIDDALQQGKNLVCAGYVLYSSSTVMVLSLGLDDGVRSFTLDPTFGEFVETASPVASINPPHPAPPFVLVRLVHGQGPHARACVCVLAHGRQFSRRRPSDWGFAAVIRAWLLALSSTATAKLATTRGGHGAPDPPTFSLFYSPAVFF